MELHRELRWPQRWRWADGKGPRILFQEPQTLHAQVFPTTTTTGTFEVLPPPSGYPTVAVQSQTLSTVGLEARGFKTFQRRANNPTSLNVASVTTQAPDPTSLHTFEDFPGLTFTYTYTDSIPAAADTPVSVPLHCQSGTTTGAGQSSSTRTSVSLSRETTAQGISSNSGSASVSGSGTSPASTLSHQSTDTLSGSNGQAQPSLSSSNTSTSTNQQSGTSGADTGPTARTSPSSQPPGSQTTAHISTVTQPAGLTQPVSNKTDTNVSTATQSGPNGAGTRSNTQPGPSSTPAGSTQPASTQSHGTDTRPGPQGAVTQTTRTDTSGSSPGSTAKAPTASTSSGTALPPGATVITSIVGGSTVKETFLPTTYPSLISLTTLSTTSTTLHEGTSSTVTPITIWPGGIAWQYPTLTTGQPILPAPSDPPLVNTNGSITTGTRITSASGQTAPKLTSTGPSTTSPPYSQTPHPQWATEAPLPIARATVTPPPFIRLDDIHEDGHTDHDGHPVPVFWHPHCIVRLYNKYLKNQNADVLNSVVLSLRRM